MYNVPSSTRLDRPSRGYWSACVALFAIHAFIGWFTILSYEVWIYGLESQQRTAPFWLAFAGFWFVLGVLFIPRWLSTRRQLLPWLFVLQIGAFVPIWLCEGWIFQAALEQRWFGPPHWRYLSAALWLAMLLHLWLRARRSVIGGR
ncbi:MAG TPA: hypothetical protein VD886_16630 [Herpetosiphonaceae bacterium]|nr:hypothetical protein [Herpetosiphonaceae bacterium]